jgi:hypothetical protein
MNELGPPLCPLCGAAFKSEGVHGGREWECGTFQTAWPVNLKPSINCQSKVMGKLPWLPIGSAPRDRPILLAVGRCVGSGRWRTARPPDATGHGFYADGCDRQSGATHWMPVPPPPESH